MPRATNKVNLVDDAAMTRGGELLMRAMVKHAPYPHIKDAISLSRISKEGAGSGSKFITVIIDTSDSGGAPDARAFDIGSGIHGPSGKTYKITARNYPLLQFQGTNKFDGSIIRKFQVDHPGVAGVHYTKAAADEVRDEIRQIILEDGKKNIRLYLRAAFSEYKKK